MNKMLGLIFALSLSAMGQGTQSGSVPSSRGLVQRGSTTAVDRDDQLRLTLNPEQFGQRALARERTATIARRSIEPFNMLLLGPV